MFKKAAVYVLFISMGLFAAFGAAAYFNIRFMPFNIGNDVSRTTEEDVETKLRRIYDINFVFDKITTRTANIYLPKYMPPDEASTAYYLKQFGFDEDESFQEEDDDYKIYTDNYNTLYADKYCARLTYESMTSGQIGDSFAPDDEVMNKALEIIEEKLPETAYDFISMKHGQDGFIIRFVKKLDYYYDYAFPCYMLFNKNGELQSIEYYYFNYEKIANVDVKTMKDAYLELPLDYPDGTRIDIMSCSLVYIYDDSVIQPAYMFEGQIAGDPEDFEWFVKAAVYS